MKSKITQTEKEQLIKALLPRIERMVDHTIKYFPDGTEKKDFVQIGAIGALKSLEKYDESKKIPLAQYALMRARGEILDEYRKLMPHSRNSWKNQKKIEQAVKELKDAFIEPTYKAIAEKIGCSEKKLRKMISQLGAIQFFSYEQYGNSEMVGDAEKTPYKIVEKRLLVKQLSDAINNLSKTEQIVLSLYYEEMLGLKDIGRVLDISESRVCQIKNGVILKLRSNFKNLR